jgi:hypothetical protein
MMNKNCTRFDRWECEMVATEDEFDESGSRTYLSDRSYHGKDQKWVAISTELEAEVELTKKNALAQNV